jgi:hypothetical protein
LLAIADHAGLAWSERGRRALSALFGMQAGGGGNAEAGTLLLADIRAIFQDRFKSPDENDLLPSVAIAAALAEMETSPWPEWKAGKPITVRQVARALAPFGVRPGAHRLSGGAEAKAAGAVVKGYRRADFAEVWARYLSDAAPISAAQDDQIDGPIVPAIQKGTIDRLHGNIAVSDGGIHKKASVTPSCVLPLEFVRNPSAEQRCYRVTDEKASNGRAGMINPHAGTAIGEAEGEL